MQDILIRTREVLAQADATVAFVLAGVAVIAILLIVGAAVFVVRMYTPKGRLDMLLESRAPERATNPWISRGLVILTVVLVLVATTLYAERPDRASRATRTLSTPRVWPRTPMPLSRVPNATARPERRPASTTRYGMPVGCGRTTCRPRRSNRVPVHSSTPAPACRATTQSPKVSSRRAGFACGIRTSSRARSHARSATVTSVMLSRAVCRSSR
jgi:hypothetical protein